MAWYFKRGRQGGALPPWQLAFPIYNMGCPLGFLFAPPPFLKYRRLSDHPRKPQNTAQYSPRISWHQDISERTTKQDNNLGQHQHFDDQYQTHCNQSVYKPQNSPLLINFQLLT